MTQNTQTTAERIATLINEGVDCSCDGGWTHESVVGVLEVAAVIAAEIDALTRERDEARAELAGLDAGMRFQFDRAEDYKAQRDEARAEVATLTLKLANARLNLKHCSEEVDKRDECAGQLAESRAEVESCRKAYAQMRSTEDEWKRDTLAALKAEADRLRPAAEAWEAYDDYMTCPETEEAAKFPVWIAAHRAAKGAQAARAAKESQP